MATESRVDFELLKSDGTQLQKAQAPTKEHDVYVFPGTAGKTEFNGKNNTAIREIDYPLATSAADYINKGNKIGIKLLTTMRGESYNQPYEEILKWIDGEGIILGAVNACSQNCTSDKPEMPTGLHIAKTVSGETESELIWNEPKGEKNVDYNGFKFYCVKDDEKNTYVNSDGIKIELDDPGLTYNATDKTYTWQIRENLSQGTKYIYYIYSAKFNDSDPICKEQRSEKASSCSGVASWTQPSFELIEAPIELPISIIKKYSYNLLPAQDQEGIIEPDQFEQIVNINLNPIYTVTNPKHTFTLKGGSAQNALVQVKDVPAQSNASIMIKLLASALYPKTIPSMPVSDAIKVSKNNWNFLPKDKPAELSVCYSAETPVNRVFAFNTDNLNYKFCDNTGTVKFNYALAHTVSFNPYSFEYADETARNTASGLLASDVGKVAIQKSDVTYWILTSVTPAPTWEQMIQLQIASGGKGQLFICGPATSTETKFKISTKNVTPALNYTGDEKGFDKFEFNLPASYPLQITAKDGAFFDSLHFAFTEELKTFNVTRRAGVDTKIRVKT